MNRALILAGAFSLGVAAAGLVMMSGSARAQYPNPYQQNQPQQLQQAHPQFNPYSGKWEMANPGSSPQFNPYNGQWQMAPQGAHPQFNPYSGQWEYGH